MILVGLELGVLYSDGPTLDVTQSLCFAVIELQMKECLPLAKILYCE